MSDTLVCDLRQNFDRTKGKSENMMTSGRTKMQNSAWAPHCGRLRLTISVISLLLFAVSAHAIEHSDVFDTHPDPHLLAAVKRAFGDSAAFRATGLFDCMGYSPSQVTQMAEVTPRPAEVTVEASPADPAHGTFHRLAVRCQKVRYYNMIIDHAVFEFSEIELDPNALAEDRLVFRRTKNVRVETFVSAADLLKIFELVARARRLSNLKMEIDEHAANLKGEVKQGFITVRFSLSGTPQITGIRQIHFHCRSLVLNGLKMPQGVIRGIFSSINPVFDANQTWLNLELEKIVLQKGFVRTWAWIKPPATTVPRKQITGKIGEKGELGNVSETGKRDEISNTGKMIGTGKIGETGKIGKIYETGKIGKIGETGNIGKIGETGKIGKICETGKIGKIGETGNIGKIGGTGKIGKMRETGKTGNYVEAGNSGKK